MTNIRRSSKANKIKRKDFIEYMFPVMTYLSEKLALITAHTKTLEMLESETFWASHFLTKSVTPKSGSIKLGWNTSVISSRNQNTTKRVTPLDNRWAIRVREWTPRKWVSSRGQPNVIRRPHTQQKTNFT